MWTTDEELKPVIVEILQEAVEKDREYEAASFKRVQKNLGKEELQNLTINDLAKDTNFRNRVANSPIYHHLRATLPEALQIYRNWEVDRWKSLSLLVPGHNQACERLVGDLKLSKDVNQLVAITEARKKRPRTANHVLKGL